MDTRQRFGIAGALLAAGLLASALALPELPSRVVVHWGPGGAADGYGPPLFAALFLPAVAAGLLALFAVLPRVDPLGENVAAFRAAYDWLVVATVGFLVLLHLAVLAVNLGYDVAITDVAAVGFAALFWVLGGVLARAERNWFVGIRTPWTLSSDEVWDRTHALGGWLFRATGVLALGALLVPEYAVVFFVGPVLVVAVGTGAYSYWLYRRLDPEPAVGTG